MKIYLIKFFSGPISKCSSITQSGCLIKLYTSTPLIRLVLDWRRILITCLKSTESEIFSYLLDAAEWNEKLQKSIILNIEELLIYSLQTRSYKTTKIILDQYSHHRNVRRISKINLDDLQIKGNANFVILKKQIQRFQVTGTFHL